MEVLVCHIKNVDLKKNRLPDISQAKIGLFRISRNLGCATMESRMQVPSKEESLYREEKEVGRAIVNKGSTALHWLSCCQDRSGVF